MFGVDGKVSGITTAVTGVGFLPGAVVVGATHLMVGVAHFTKNEFVQQKLIRNTNIMSFLKP